MVILCGSSLVSGDNVIKPVINMPDPYKDDQVEVEYICTEDETESVLGRLIEAEYFAKQGKLRNGTYTKTQNIAGSCGFFGRRQECRNLFFVNAWRGLTRGSEKLSFLCA